MRLADLIDYQDDELGGGKELLAALGGASAGGLGGMKLADKLHGRDILAPGEKLRLASKGTPKTVRHMPPHMKEMHGYGGAALGSMLAQYLYRKAHES